MVRHYCPYAEEMVLCIAESRGDDIDCDKCEWKKNPDKIKEKKE